MIYYAIFRKDGSILCSNLDDCKFRDVFIGKEVENTPFIDGVRNIYREYEDGMVRLVVTVNEKSTNRILTRIADAYASFIPILYKNQEDINSKFTIFSHNLITAHAKLQGEIESVISGRELSRCKTHQEQLNKAITAVSTDIDGTSNSILQMMNRVVDLQAQIEGMKMLSGNFKLDFGYHNIKKVLLNILYSFYEDFENIGVDVRMHISDDLAEKNQVRLDYKIFNVALHHFFNNAVKYIEQYSKIDITFNKKSQVLEFRMWSTKIDKDELMEIRRLGVSGRNAGKNAGYGVGMYMIDKSLELLGGRFEIHSDWQKHKVVNETQYTLNSFRFIFPIS